MSVESQVTVSNLLPEHFVERHVLEERVLRALKGLGAGPWFVTLRPAPSHAGPHSASVELRNDKGPIAFAIAQPADSAALIAERLSLFRFPQ